MERLSSASDPLVLVPSQHLQQRSLIKPAPIFWEIRETEPGIICAPSVTEQRCYQERENVVLGETGENIKSISRPIMWTTEMGASGRASIPCLPTQLHFLPLTGLEEDESNGTETHKHNTNPIAFPSNW